MDFCRQHDITITTIDAMPVFSVFSAFQIVLRLSNTLMRFSVISGFIP